MMVCPFGLVEVADAHDQRLFVCCPLVNAPKTWSNGRDDAQADSDRPAR